MINHVAILGAMGDLTSRYLLPALARLQQTGRLPRALRITAVSREDIDTAAYRERIKSRLGRFAEDVAAATREELVARLEYRRADVGNKDEVARALEPLDVPVAAYLALPPAVFPAAVGALAEAGLPKGSRVVVEKPFGENLASARALNALLHETFSESAVFRVDHFLALQTVQNVLGLRFANRVFELLWNREHVERVEIVWDETLALEGRASYYDRAGALRDVIQNHLLQLLCLVGMEPPLTLGERDLRDRKVDVLRAVRRMSAEEVTRHTRRGRYTAGRIGDSVIPSYVDEEGVDPARGTETFAEIILSIDNWRWSGVPFILRTGKALAADRRHIAVWFRGVPHLAFQQNSPEANVLRLELDPDRMSLSVNINGPGDPFVLECVELQKELAPQDIPAYGLILQQVLEGDTTLSIRADEAEESWRIVEPILAAWEQNTARMLEYPAGTAGPNKPAAPTPG